MEMSLKVLLKEILTEIEANETNYDRREVLVATAVATAKQLGYPAGVRVDLSEPDPWPVWCIDLPEAGEVSWHSPPYKKLYDGCSTEEKYRRCHLYKA